MGGTDQGRPEAATSARRIGRGRRWLLIAASTAAAAGCIVWSLAAALAWTFRGLMVGVDSPQGVADTHFALVVIAVAVANVAVLAAFLVSRMAWGWWVLVTVQAADLSFAGYESLTRSPWWLAVTALSAPAVLVLLLGRRAG